MRIWHDVVDVVLREENEENEEKVSPALELPLEPREVDDVLI